MPALTPDQFRLVDELFHELEGQAPSTREERLRQIDGDQPEVAHRVRRLLRASSTAQPDGGHTLESALQLHVGEVSRPPDIPPYRIGDLLGMGGMGQVWAATQSEPIRRRVAIKLIQPGLSTHAVLERFRSERRALAIMDHPGIARVHEAGSTNDGRPYFVMERVDGVPIDRHCDDRRLAVRQRIELIVQACRAVAHAHQRGVIHRDLKPSNLLVATSHEREQATGAGFQVKIIDFGIAKATDPSNSWHGEADRTITRIEALTALGQPLGTLDYMSPEQARGEFVDTRTDVYALGALLHHLLVDGTPHHAAAEQVTLATLQSRIQNDDPIELQTALRRHPDPRACAQRRSMRVDELRRTLRGDLTWIVSRALERDPERRYASPLELAADLQRHLDDRPVLAGPASPRYRLTKLYRRRKPAVLAGLAATLAFALGGAGLVAGWVRSDRAERRAIAEAAESQATRDFLLSLFEVVDPEVDSPRDLTAPDLLARGAERLRQELVAQPDLEADLSQTIGRLYVQMGLYDEATQHLARAVTLRQQLGAAGPLGSALLELARHRMDIGDFAEAIVVYTSAAAQFRAAGRNAHEDLVRSLTELSSSHRMLGQIDAGLGASQEAMDLAPQLLEASSPVHAPVLSNHAALLWSQADYDGAGAAWQAAIDHTTRYLGPDHHFLGSLHQNLGNLRLAQERIGEAVELTEEALRLDAARYGEQHPYTALARTSLGATLRQAGRLADAERQLLGAAGVLESSGHAGLENALRELGVLQQDRRSWSESLITLQRALAETRRLYGEVHQDTATSWMLVARSLRALGRFDEARQHAAQAEDVARRTLGERSALALQTAAEGIEVDLAQGRLVDAEHNGRRVLLDATQMLGADHPATLTYRLLLARVLQARGQLEAADGEAEIVRAAIDTVDPLHPLRRELTRW